MAAWDSSLPKHKGLSQVEKVMLSYWFKIRPFKGLSQVEKVMSSYWFKIRHFYSEENGVDMLHPYSIVSMLYLGGLSELGVSKQ